MNPNITSFLEKVSQKNPHEPEFIQAVQEVAETVIPFIEEHSIYNGKDILLRMTEPERVVIFRVCWLNDKGEIQINRGYRVQMNSAIGPYKGGLRFHPSVNLSILKFLAFEQVFKNSLTTLPMGGGKGGSDFDPKGKSETEIMRFCHAFMLELHRHIGANTDVPAGDIGVGAKEVGYMFGMYKKIQNEFTGVLTGKGLSWGGSLIRPEATGYGTVYFAENMLATKSNSIKGKKIVISGSGNVAQHAAEKAIQLGGKVLTLSDSNGFIYNKDGISLDILEQVMELKNTKRGRLSDLKLSRIEYFDNQSPWIIPCDVAFPCATQNEITGKQAKVLLKNGLSCLAEGANMPSTYDAIQEFLEAKILYAPGKASNAGGVATSGLEMSQNSLRLNWTKEEIDQRLKEIISGIHKQCVNFGSSENNFINYVQGANIAGFVKVADAMLAQGVI